MKYVFLFSLQLLFEIHLIVRRIQRDIFTNVQKFSCKSGGYSCQILTKLEFYRKIFEISLNINMYMNQQDSQNSCD